LEGKVKELEGVFKGYLSSGKYGNLKSMQSNKEVTKVMEELR